MTYAQVLRSTKPIPTKHSLQIREREILRVSGILAGDDHRQSVLAARQQVLRWAQNKAPRKFASEAWNHQSFEQLSSGRSRVAVRLTLNETDYWSIRVEDPDKTVAGRIWTTEVTISENRSGIAAFTARLLVGSPEENLEIEPHVPGVVRQIISAPGLLSGLFRVTDKAHTIRTEKAAKLLTEALVNSTRTLPIIVLSVPSSSADPERPLLNAKTLAEACAGLAIVIILPADFTWALTERFGKRLSVYEGAVRIYLPGFTEDANPFGGHELILSHQMVNPDGANKVLTQLRWMAANASVRRLLLGKDIVPFASLRLRTLEKKQLELQESGATEKEQLEATREALKTLEAQVEEAERFQQQFSDLHDAAEERAEIAETQLRAAGFRIQQLLEQIKESGVSPDANIELPLNWEVFEDWCDANLAGRVILSPQARRGVRNPEFEDTSLAARCLLWLGNEFRLEKLNESEGPLRDRVLENGVLNAHCGNDSFEIDWQGKRYAVNWHIKNGGNTRDPIRCLRIYYFWDGQSQQVVVASMPTHRRTDAT